MSARRRAALAAVALAAGAGCSGAPGTSGVSGRRTASAGAPASASATTASAGAPASSSATATSAAGPTGRSEAAAPPAALPRPTGGASAPPRAMDDAPGPAAVPVSAPSGGAGAAARLAPDGAADAADAAPAAPMSSAPAPRYLKGSTHVHAAPGSGDSATPLPVAVRWYIEHGYDFIVVTDHNRVTRHHDDELLVLSGVELTNNPASCDPPPPSPRGKCRIHAGALFVSERAERARAARAGRAPGSKIVWRELRSRRRVDKYQAALRVCAELGAVCQLNHPRWHWGVDGALLAALARRGFVLVEIANEAFRPWNRGAAGQPSAEAIWDEALTAGAVIWGAAADDAHHYYDADAARAAGSPVYPAGTGFVMVKAARDPAAIRTAIEQGEFYSSTGVVLARVDRGPGWLSVEVSADSPGDHAIAFIGAGGRVLAEARGRAARHELPRSVRGPGRYVRAVVTDAAGRKAWTQPALAPPR